MTANTNTKMCTELVFANQSFQTFDEHLLPSPPASSKAGISRYSYQNRSVWLSALLAYAALPDDPAFRCPVYRLLSWFRHQLHRLFLLFITQTGRNHCDSHFILHLRINYSTHYNRRIIRSKLLGIAHFFKFVNCHIHTGGDIDQNPEYPG